VAVTTFWVNPHESLALTLVTFVTAGIWLLSHLGRWGTFVLPVQVDTEDMIDYRLYSWRSHNGNGRSCFTLSAGISPAVTCHRWCLASTALDVINHFWHLHAAALHPTMSVHVSILNISKPHLNSGVMADVSHDVLCKHMCDSISHWSEAFSDREFL
jgi:hypothetical protein